MKNKINLKLVIPLVIFSGLAYFSISLFWNPRPATVSFELNPNSKTNFSTAHFSFYIPEVEYDDAINEVSNFIITPKGRITFSEKALISFNPIKESHYSPNELESNPANSMMEFILAKEKKITLKLMKNWYIRDIKPIIFHSSQLKAMLLNVDGKQMLEITTEDKKQLLLIQMNSELDREYALEILKTVRFRTD